MENSQLTLIVTTLGVLIAATGPGMTAALVTAAFLCGVLVTELARRGP